MSISLAVTVLGFWYFARAERRRRRRMSAHRGTSRTSEQALSNSEPACAKVEHVSSQPAPRPSDEPHRRRRRPARCFVRRAGGRGVRHHRAQRGGEEHAAQDPVAHNERRAEVAPHARARRQSPRGRYGISPGSHWARERVSQRHAARHVDGARSTRHSTRSSTSRASDLHRYADQAVLERHAAAPRVRGGGPPGRGHDDHRRGPCGRRCGVPGEMRPAQCERPPNAAGRRCS